MGDGEELLDSLPSALRECKWQEATRLITEPVEL